MPCCKKEYRLLLFFSFLGLLLISSIPLCLAREDYLKNSINTPLQDNADYQSYLDFFEEVYKYMDDNYYHEVTRDDYQRFIHVFNTKIYPQLQNSGKTINYIKWRSTAYLVDFLKSQDDIFSAFFPPLAAKDYEEEVLGKRIDLGIEGILSKEGFRITRMEPRSDAFLKGLNEKDILLTIAGKNVTAFTQEEIVEMLVPLEGEKVVLNYYDETEQAKITIEVESVEYFKQTVFMIPVEEPNVFCLQIQRFNRKTSEDMTRFMNYILRQDNPGLIIDLRGNPGGPPLAAREISAFFLPPLEEFVYFQRKNKPKAVLDVPKIPEPYHFKGDIVILVNKESGSASELFAGILQGRGRAVVMGSNTAGQVFLKSMFPFEDESMLLLVTARGFHPDGTVFSYEGVVPDEKKEDDGSLINFAASYLAEKRISN
ncbi:MAG: PDZ domain-containing protein [Candidatus Omnitrophica bacterium]|nr:PDZ domain-containing protein [Candidatus Omnitrophota bacterium]